MVEKELTHPESTQPQLTWEQFVPLANSLVRASIIVESYRQNLDPYHLNLRLELNQPDRPKKNRHAVRVARGLRVITAAQILLGETNFEEIAQQSNEPAEVVR